MQARFKTYCQQWSADVSHIAEEKERMAYFQRRLPELLLDRDTVRAIMVSMTQGNKWPDLRQSGLFTHEILLYLDPGHRFSIRLYFHPAGTHTDIHDHTSWGVSGAPFGALSVIQYHCDGGIEQNHAHIRRIRQAVFKPGEVDLTLPWDQGIHQTGSGNDAPNVMISAYGRPGRRLYVHRFDAANGTVERIYPPRLLRRMLAKEVLEAFGAR